MVRRFGWLSTGPLPARFDLRRCGWDLTCSPQSLNTSGHPVLLIDGPVCVAEFAGERSHAIILEVHTSVERARLLVAGFADAVGAIGMDELDVRAAAVVLRTTMLPRIRRVGALTLDLLRRDGLVAERPLGLHPREFALLWRLAECPGRSVGAGRLLSDVWRLSFRPETNSLAVHVSRLRAKMRVAGLDGIVVTGPDGSYQLVTGTSPDIPGDLALGAHVSIDSARDHAQQDRSLCATN